MASVEDQYEQDEQRAAWGDHYTFAADDKRRFAAELLKAPKDPMAAAVATFGHDRKDIGKCSYVATVWPTDLEIIAIQRELLKGGGIKDFLPTKDEVSRRVWQWTENGPFDDRIKAAKLYAEINDFIPKPGTAVNVNVAVPRVMEVPVSASNEDWERELQAQQAASKRDAAIVH